MPSITGKEAARFLRTMNARLADGIKKEIPIAFLAAEADVKIRVFRDGKATGGGSIGQYSQKPFYADIPALRAQYGSQLPLSRLKAVGKPRYGRKKGFTTRRYGGERIDLVSQYMQGGYKEFREKLGRDGSKVNLKLSGNLERSIVTGYSGLVGVIGFSNPSAADLARKHEDRYSVDIFELSQKEKDRVYKRLQAAALKALTI